jgi:homoserine kinase
VIEPVRVSVPASSANLGPGFDSFAAALSLRLELEVAPADAFALHTDLPVPTGRENLCVRAFEQLHPADGLEFRMRSEIPLSGGLGSSAAAVLAGLLAAARLGNADADVLALASELEGHGDNVAAALTGGFVICVDGAVTRIEPPTGLEAVIVVPDEPVATERARAALPQAVAFEEAAFNVAHAGLLALGLERGEWELLSRGLEDRLHQSRRADLFPRSFALLERARAYGALGATVSGAGPSILVWCLREQVGAVCDGLGELAAGWASVQPVRFDAQGARVS